MGYPAAIPMFITVLSTGAGSAVPLDPEVFLGEMQFSHGDLASLD